MKDHAYALGPEGFGVYTFDWSRPGIGLERSDREEAPLVICPGFVDLHIHGAFGIDFMQATRTQMAELADKLVAIGYEAFLPTTVSADAGAVAAALEQLPDHPAIAGFHLEGPFLSPNYPGAQPPSAICDPNTAGPEWDPIFDHPELRVVTLAPERPGAGDLIRRLTERGVVVSMGHTDATFDEAKSGVDSGVRQATHTYNAMKPLHHREAGATGSALTDDRLFAELIYDGVHVCREAAEVLFRCKGPNKVIAVSDASLAAGLEPGTEVEMWGLKALVGENDVRLASGALAGSTITLADAFQLLLADFGVERAIKACSVNPRRQIGLPGIPKTWLLMDAQGRLLEKHEQR